LRGLRLGSSSFVDELDGEAKPRSGAIAVGVAP
jgi:hypothetical protein